MKKVILLAMLAITTLCVAVEVDYSGSGYSRFIAHNEYTKGWDGNWLENKFAFTVTPKLADNLSVAWTLQVYNTTWGDTTTVTDGNNAIDIQNYEMYFDYQSSSLKNTHFKVGKQYWADRRSLIFDDAFWAGIATNEELGCFSAMLGGVQWIEKDKYDRDDYYILMGDLSVPKENWTVGTFGMYGNNQADRYSNLLLMPYGNLQIGGTNIDLTLLGDIQNPVSGKNTLGWAAALKTSSEFGNCTVETDLLAADKDGITTLYPYYMNGLYIFGIGCKHDAGGFGWYDEDGGLLYGYQNGKGFFSGVLKGNWKFTDDWKLFGAGGLVTAEINKFDKESFKANTYGYEGNLGVEYEVVPEKFNCSVFGAIGQAQELLPTDENMLFQVGANAGFSF